MTDTYSATGRLSIGRTFGRAISILRRNLLVFSGLTTLAWISLLIVEIGIVLILALVEANGGEIQNVGAVLALLNLAALFLLVGFTQAIASHGAVCLLEERKARFRETLLLGLKSAFPAGLLASISLFAVTLGSAFLLAPGIFLGLLLALVIPAYVVDGAGLTGAFGRSVTLSENNRLRLLGFLSLANLALSLTVVLVAVASVFLLGALIAVFHLGDGSDDATRPMDVVVGLTFTVGGMTVGSLALLAGGIVPAAAWAELVTLRGEGRKRADIANLFD